MQTKDFFRKLGLFLLPLLAWCLVESVFLPKSFFAFRAWEALRVNYFTHFYTGPFYPLADIRLTEQGDLGAHTAHAVPKQVVWKTDARGFRVDPALALKNDIILIGDSMAAGTSLSQEDTLASVLHERTGRNVYPYAPGNMESVLNDPEFYTSKPKIVIYESVERWIKDLGEIANLETHIQPTPSSFLADLLEPIDHLTKQSQVRYLASKIKRTFTGPKYPLVDGLLFFEGPTANNPPDEKTFEETVMRIKVRAIYFSRLRMKFYFLPVPNKENFHHQRLKTAKPLFLKNLITRLERESVPVFDTQTAFDAASARGVDLYHPDDSHWNAAGVKVTADVIVEKLKRDGLL